MGIEFEGFPTNQTPGESVGDSLPIAQTDLSQPVEATKPLGELDTTNHLQEWLDLWRAEERLATNLRERENKLRTPDPADLHSPIGDHYPPNR